MNAARTPSNEPDGTAERSGPAERTGTAQSPGEALHVTFGSRLLRLLPRIALLLVLITILIVFRAVLLPFALAIFLAFLLYPLVARLEHGRIAADRLPRWVPGRASLGRLPAIEWRIPRWLAVISVYAVLITLGWWTLPPMAISLASEFTQLKDSLPQLFRSVNDWQGNAQQKIARLLEVQAPTQANLDELSNALKQLRTGKLGPLSKLPPPLPPSSAESPTEPAAEPVSGTAGAPSFSLVHVEIVLPDGRGRGGFSFGGPRDAEPSPARHGEGGAAADGTGKDLSERDDTERDDSERDDSERDDTGSPEEADRDGTESPSSGADVGDLPEHDADPSPTQEAPSGADPRVDEPIASESSDAAAQGPGDLVPAEDPEIERFSHEARRAMEEDLQENLKKALAEPGPAPRDLPDRMGQLVLDLNQRHLGLPSNDEGLLAFKELVQNQVRSMIRREEYIDLVERETQTALGTARSWVADQLKRTTRGVTAVVVGIFDFFLILMLTAFFLVFFPRVVDYVRDLVPPQYREDYNAIIGRIDTRLSGAIRGQVIICLVNGVLTYPGVYWCGRLFDAPVLSSFALLLSLVAVVLSLIPIFGVIISTVPMVLLALTQSFWAALAVIAWICLVHAIEAYILNPHILGHSAQMNPIIVVFALLAGKNAGGLVGALLAVPIAAVAVALFGYYRRRLARVYAAESGQEAPEDRWDD